MSRAEAPTWRVRRRGPITIPDWRKTVACVRPAIRGDAELSTTWQVFAPLPPDFPAPTGVHLRTVPADNSAAVPSGLDQLGTLSLAPGQHLLVVRFISGSVTSRFAVAGPSALARLWAEAYWWTTGG